MPVELHPQGRPIARLVPSAQEPATGRHGDDVFGEFRSSWPRKPVRPGGIAVADQLTARAAELLDKIVSDESVKSPDHDNRQDRVWDARRGSIEFSPDADPACKAISFALSEQGR